MTDVECGNEKASCRCDLPADHPGIHMCSCQGSWDANGKPVTFPDAANPVGRVQPKPINETPA